MTSWRTLPRAQTSTMTEIVYSTTEDALDQAMEREWERRGEWRAIGAEAAERIRTLVPPRPARELADTLPQVVTEAAPAMARPARQPIDASTF